MRIAYGWENLYLCGNLFLPSMSLNINYEEDFKDRHIAPNAADTLQMLSTVGVSTVDELIEQTIPEKIRLKQALNLPAAKSEKEYLETLKQRASSKQGFQILHRTGLL
jgi:glycine dehydrogenase